MLPQIPLYLTVASCLLDYPALMERVPFNTFAANVAVAADALHVSRFFTVEAGARVGGPTIEVGANFIAHNG